MANVTESVYNGQTTNNRFWANDLEGAFAEARATGKYVLIAVGADTCRNWRLAMALAFMDEDMIDLSRQFQCVMVNDNRPGEGRFAGKYDVTQYPTVLVCDPNGREICRTQANTFEELVPSVQIMLQKLAERLTARPAMHFVFTAKSFGCGSRPRRSGRPSLLRVLVCSVAHAILGV